MIYFIAAMVAVVLFLTFWLITLNKLWASERISLVRRDEWKKANAKVLEYETILNGLDASVIQLKVSKVTGDVKLDVVEDIIKRALADKDIRAVRG